jgi:hypothetical protein
MQKHIKQFLFILIFLILALPIFGKSKRVGQIPNGSINGCANCHTNPNGGGARNDFGKLVGTKFLDNNGDVVWNAELAAMDSDGDGISNGDELQDQFGSWISGTTAPGIASAVSNPGEKSSTKLQMVTVHLTSMTPHIGSKLYMRAIDKSTGKESSRNMIESLVAEQNLELDNLIAGHNYFIDFFADRNANGLYDAPPTDHAWRLDANNVQGDVIEFVHNTNFTDIEWKYQLTINFLSFSPHLGEMLEFTVEEETTSMEIARMKIPSVPSESFSKTISGLMLDKQYKIKVYADHNSNGIYDAPPTDHAWSMSFTNSTGDASVDFMHNTNFEDISWKYIYTLNLLNMDPHLGKMLELRIVSSDTDQEIGRKTIKEIFQPNFSVSIPNVELGVDYKVDFYADHNGNGNYDAPPTDHAWRTTFTTSMGNSIANFTHNTNFTDINWQPTVDVSENGTLNLSEYRLEQNYPNPFNPTTNILFNLKESGFVNLKIYNILGEEVATLLNNILPSGQHSIEFDASNLQSGTYIYRIQSNGFTAVKKMILLK